MPLRQFAARLEAVSSHARDLGIDVVLITPGPDLRYVVGYDAIPLERLTCLIVPAEGDPSLVVPRLEVLAAKASPVGDLGLEHPLVEQTSTTLTHSSGR